MEHRGAESVVELIEEMVGLITREGVLRIVE